jgi:glucose/mannose-6-phosphate isomerase
VLDERLLDDGTALADADPSGSLRAVAGAGAQIRASITAAEAARVARVAEDGRPRAIVVAGLGGSAVVGDVLTTLAGSGSPVPMSVHRGLPLPGWVGPLDLVIAVSMSGRAPGPVGLATEAARRGARLLTVGLPGSPLAGVAEQAQGVHVPVPPPSVPAAKASRLALWSLLTPVLVAAYELGLVDVSRSVLDRLADRLDDHAVTYRPSSESFVNPAKTVALDLAGSIPVVLGDGDITGLAAGRIVSMLARTARIPAMRGALPDDAGDVVATFGGPFATSPEGLFADPFTDGESAARLRLLFLRDAVPTVPPPEGNQLETSRTADAVQATAAEAGVRVTEVTAQPGHPLERFGDLVVLGDFASVYLALAAGLDPVTSPHVADLRDRTR